MQDVTRVPALEATTLDALKATLVEAKLDAAFRAAVLTVPSESMIAEQMTEVDPQRIHTVREAVRMQLATELQNEWQLVFDNNQTSGSYSPDATSSGKRAIANMALMYLCLADKATAGKAYQRVIAPSA